MILISGSEVDQRDEFKSGWVWTDEKWIWEGGS